MQQFTFIERKNELTYVKENFIKNNILLFNADNKSGLTHFLKKLWLDLCEDNNLCFYIDGENNQNIANQILLEVLKGTNGIDIKSKLKQYPKKDIIYAFIKMFIYPLDFIPYPSNIGSVLVNIMDCINETIDVDIEHINDYKTEKAIFHLFKKLNKCVYFIIDNSEKLSPDSFTILTQLLNSFEIKIILTFPNCNIDKKLEIISKNFSNTPYKLNQLNEEFARPSNQLIKALFDCYNKKFENSLLDFFVRYNRNIHVIMSYINGFTINQDTLSENKIYLLKILKILNTDICRDCLYKIYTYNDTFLVDDTREGFELLCNSLIKLSFININSNGSLKLNDHLINEMLLDISFIEQQILTRQIIDVLSSVETITVEQCKFAIHHLSKDYTRKKYFIMKLINIENINNTLEAEFLDMVFSFDNLNELIKVCVLYYNMHIFDAPNIKLQLYSKYKNGMDYKIMNALISERLHKGRYANKLENIIFHINNTDKKCLLLSTLFVAYLNTNNIYKKNQILYDQNNELYYKKFSRSQNYPYLLRNISYYIEDPEEAIKNYTYCLSQFKNKDSINYNRTISNFICYLLKNDHHICCLRKIEQIIPKVKHILEFNDERYMYLNNNYGIYLLKYKKDNPKKYFECINYSTGTTETPYLYAQINLALSTAVFDAYRAIEILDSLEFHINETPIKMTKQLYNINRCLIEYMLGNKNYILIDKIKADPYRGDKKYVDFLYKNYKYRFDNNIDYSKEDFEIFCCPGYLFYRYYDANKLFL